MARPTISQKNTKVRKIHRKSQKKYTNSLQLQAPSDSVFLCAVYKLAYLLSYNFEQHLKVAKKSIILDRDGYHLVYSVVKRVSSFLMAQL